MSKTQWLAILGLAGLATISPTARAQQFFGRPYIGFVYPAGGQQGTTFQVKLGGQALEGITGAIVSGSGVSARLVDYHRRLNPQDMQLLSQQLERLRSARTKVASRQAPVTAPTTTTGGDEMMMMSSEAAAGKASGASKHESTQQLIERIQKRMREYVQRPACASLASIAYVEVTIAPDAPPGERELRLVTLRGGASNPLPFYVGQLPEHCRKPMGTTPFQVLGKEQLALRKRPEYEVEDRITIPCTVNGQIASGEINRYRFDARKGQRLVITTLARQLIPYIADAVPGWFQPVLALYDAEGNELAYEDDYRFKPDPTIVYQIPKDGEYVFTITDAIYRGREDFVYRVTIGELPLITSIFPLGGRVGEPHAIKMNGENLAGARLTPPPKNAGPGIQMLVATKDDFVSNPVPFALDTLPETFDKEPNNTDEHAQKVTLPVIVNGRIDKKDDWDVFEFAGKAGDVVVAEVYARRLDSPVDSVIKLTDAQGQLLAFNDDHEDLGAGINTHHADSYFMARLPADGAYFVHIGDTGRKGGQEYGYRLRISAPRPDFALRIMPSSASVRQRGSATLTVFAMRQDGFDGPIRINLKNPPAGFTAYPATMSGTQNIARFSFKADTPTQAPINLTVIGTAEIGGQKVTRVAVPAEDKMQAFLWRHLVPAQNLKVLVYNPSHEPPPKRVPPELSPEQVAQAKAKAEELRAKGQKFSKNQVAGRVRQIRSLFEEGLLTDDFYCEKIAECGAATP
ncbi:MAG: PPC domain-containing protein [Verrucomicrobiae bacterium]|nr:PPC domain-containing protein [Verrucomicrobiae bacterium]